jgi:hypothetical protein
MQLQEMIFWRVSALRRKRDAMQAAPQENRSEKLQKKIWQRNFSRRNQLALAIEAKQTVPMMTLFIGLEDSTELVMLERLEDVVARAVVVAHAGLFEELAPNSQRAISPEQHATHVHKRCIEMRQHDDQEDAALLVKDGQLVVASAADRVVVRIQAGRRGRAGLSTQQMIGPSHRLAHHRIVGAKWYASWLIAATINKVLPQVDVAGAGRSNG